MDVYRCGRSPMIPSEFPQFRLLPPELRAKIWEAACPGPRLIEVYLRPGYLKSGEYGEIGGYEWQSHQCECEERCMLPLRVGQVCSMSRKIFKKVQGKYAKCFGTYVNWEKDIIYVGDRTGHFHNSHFVKTISFAGGLGKVKNLAVYEDTWIEPREMHGDQAQEFKSCGPVAVAQQLSVENLIIVGKAGFFADGSEFCTEVDERGWLWNSDTECPSNDEEHDNKEVKKRKRAEKEESFRKALERLEEFWRKPPVVNPMTSIPNSVGEPVLSTENPSHATEFEAGETPHNRTKANGVDDVNDTSSLASSPSFMSDEWNLIDDWMWLGDGDDDPRIYKPHWPDWKHSQIGIPNGRCGLALVDFASIPGQPLWFNKNKKFYDESAIKADYIEDYNSVKTPITQHYEGDDDPKYVNYIDWASFKPVNLKLAFFRRSGQSCRVRDWKDLEKQYITWKDADQAKKRPRQYIKKAIRKGWYKPGDIHVNDVEDASGAVEGYGKVKYYVANNMKIPCTATTGAGKSYTRGNYINTTKKIDYDISPFVEGPLIR